MTNHIELEHVGIILKEEFMEPLGLSMNALGTAIGVPANRIHWIVHGIRGMSADTDLRLTRFFGLSQGYFLRIQNHYEMTVARRNLESQIDKIIPFKHSVVTSNRADHPRAMVA